MQSFMKKPVEVVAVQLPCAGTFIFKDELEFEVVAGDWLVVPEGDSPDVLSNEDFEDTYTVIPVTTNRYPAPADTGERFVVRQDCA